MSAAARASWLVPTAALVIVGGHESLPRTAVTSPPWLLAVAAASAVIGLVLGVTALGVARRKAELPRSVRANALVGALASAFALVVVAAAGACGSAAMREAQGTLESATAVALRNAPGWSGGGALGATSIVASSLDRRSQASKVMTHPFDRKFRVMLLSVDNRSGDHEVVVDLESVRARVAGGALRSSLPREHLLAHLRSGEDPSRLVVGTVRVPAGERFDRGQVFFDEDVTLRDAEAVELRVDGATLLVPGRYFTLAEKQAIDAARVR